MTKQTGLPTYFREYLDERFGKVLDEIQDVKEDVADLKKKMNSSDGKISRLWLAVLVIIIVLLVHFGETEGELLKIFKFI